MQQPVGSHVQEQAELIGLPARAGGLVGARVELHVLDQVLHAPARAVHLLVKKLSSTLEVGDDEAHVLAHVGGLTRAMTLRSWLQLSAAYPNWWKRRTLGRHLER